MRKEVMRYFVGLLFAISMNLGVAEELDCEKAFTTQDINRCVKKELDSYLAILNRYNEKSKEQYSEDDVVLKSIEEAQSAWENYRKAHCGSVYDRWRDGTIRTVMSLSCSIKLTKQRTHSIWDSYEYADIFILSNFLVLLRKYENGKFRFTTLIISLCFHTTSARS